jgi:hypothetical protein
VITGIYDFQAIDIIKEDVGRTVYTRCAHIVPDLTCVKLSTPGNPSEKVLFDFFFLSLFLVSWLLQKFYPSPVLAVLERFGYDVENLNGLKLHSLFNVMTMEINACDLFDRLEIWLEATVSVIHAYMPVPLSNHPRFLGSPGLLPY